MVGTWWNSTVYRFLKIVDRVTLETDCCTPREWLPRHCEMPRGGPFPRPCSLLWTYMRDCNDDLPKLHYNSFYPVLIWHDKYRIAGNFHWVQIFAIFADRPASAKILNGKKINQDGIDDVIMWYVDTNWYLCEQDGSLQSVCHENNVCPVNGCCKTDSACCYVYTIPTNP